MSKEMGKFIVIEGMDGSGKSHITKLIVEELRALGCPVRATYEIGGTPLAVELRRLCFSSNTAYETLTPAARLLMVTAARIQHLSTVILPSLQAGINMVSDRYIPSTAVYQGILDQSGKEMQLIYGDAGFAGGILQHLPDAMVFVQVDEDIAFERGVARKNLDNDLYKNARDKNVLIHQSYDQLMKEYAKISSDSTYFIDNNGSQALLEIEVKALSKLLVANNQARVALTPNS